MATKILLNITANAGKSTSIFSFLPITEIESVAWNLKLNIMSFLNIGSKREKVAIER